MMDIDYDRALFSRDDLLDECHSLEKERDKLLERIQRLEEALIYVRDYVDDDHLIVCGADKQIDAALQDTEE